MITDPESPASNAAPRKSIRLIRPSVVVLCGPAACGKSTFAMRHFRPTQIISSDRARALVCDDERDQRYSAEAFALVAFLIEQRLSINRLCVVDSTALTPPARRSQLDLARKHRVPCVVFLFDIPLETCLARDRARERSVGQTVIERHYRLFEQEKGTIEREGFDQVITLRDEDLDHVRIDVLFRPVPRLHESPERQEPRRAAFQAGRPTASNQRGYGAQRSPAGPQPSSRLVPPDAGARDRGTPGAPESAPLPRPLANSAPSQPARDPGPPLHPPAGSAAPHPMTPAAPQPASSHPGPTASGRVPDQDQGESSPAKQS